MRRTDHIGANWLGDVLHAMIAERAVAEIKFVFDLLVHSVRDADGAGLGKCLKPRSDVNTIAEYVVAIDNDVPEVDAYS